MQLIKKKPKKQRVHKKGSKEAQLLLK